MRGKNLGGKKIFSGCIKSYKGEIFRGWEKFLGGKMEEKWGCEERNQNVNHGIRKR